MTVTVVTIIIVPSNVLLIWFQLAKGEMKYAICK